MGMSIEHTTWMSGGVERTDIVEEVDLIFSCQNGGTDAMYWRIAPAL